MFPDHDDRDIRTVDLTAEPEQLTGVLHGWKEISSHFGMSARTVQRWEKEFGLPIRRFCQGPGQPVHAHVAELDRWRSRAESVSCHREVFAQAGTGGFGQAGAVAAERSARKKTTQSGVLKILVAGLASWIGK